jgi:hypothetical protein
MLRGRQPGLWAAAFGVWANRFKPTNLLWLIERRRPLVLPVPKMATLPSVPLADFGALPEELRDIYGPEILELFEELRRFAPASAR